jgi:membrane-bound metal-dependent hydrolase YbcI (DUF457 family)
MPTPLGHALGGLIVAFAATPTDHATRPVAASGNRRRLLVACAVAACLPDVDFLWGRHNMETHSIGFSVIVAGAVYMWSRSARLALACAASVGTHVLFDWLGSDDTPPLGVMALWPLTSAFFFADAFVFEAISRRYWLPGFLQHNLLAVAREVALLLPLTVVAWWWRSRPHAA